VTHVDSEFGSRPGSPHWLLTLGDLNAHWRSDFARELWTGDVASARTAPISLTVFVHVVGLDVPGYLEKHVSRWVVPAVVECMFEDWTSYAGRHTAVEQRARLAMLGVTARLRWAAR